MSSADAFCLRYQSNERRAAELLRLQAATAITGDNILVVVAVHFVVVWQAGRQAALQMGIK